jgi:hypothetical protein
MASELLLVCFVRVKPEALKGASLPEGGEMTALVDRLDQTIIDAASGALDPTAIYLVDPRHSDKLIRTVDNLALPFHDYVVNVLGEQCTNDSCDEHKPTNVVQFARPRK